MRRKLSKCLKKIGQKSYNKKTGANINANQD